jgi:hypothetical protein
LTDAEVPVYEAYGLAIAQTDEAALDVATRQRREQLRRIAEAAQKYRQGIQECSEKT